jgi:hypothetical protein
MARRERTWEEWERRGGTGAPRMGARGACSEVRAASIEHEKLGRGARASTRTTLHVGMWGAR